MDNCSYHLPIDSKVLLCTKHELYRRVQIRGMLRFRMMNLRKSITIIFFHLRIDSLKSKNLLSEGMIVYKHVPNTYR
jgi:hypothetical protein